MRQQGTPASSSTASERRAFSHSGAVLRLVMSPRWNTPAIRRRSLWVAIHRVWAVNRSTAFTGVAKARLLGLPPQAEAPELDLAADAARLVFPLKVGPEAPAGQHGNVFCQVRIPHGDGWVVQNTPPMLLRIDRPLPEKEGKP